MAASRNPVGVGVNLSSLAASGGRETQQRVAGGLRQGAASIATDFNEGQGARDSSAAGQDREHQFLRAQHMADQALERRQQAARQAAAMAARRLEILERREQLEHDQEMAGREKATWFDQQTFQTDEAIRQAQAVAAIGAREKTEESGMPALSSFGGQTISPLRGAALATEHPDFINLSPQELMNARQAVTAAAGSESPDLELDRLLRESFGKRTRAASLALYELYGLDGPTGPL